MSDSSNPQESTRPAGSSRPDSILGLSTGDLAGLSIEEITKNKVAITMVMHYYKQLVDENVSLRNDVNTLRTYVNGYQAKKLNSGVAAGLQFLAAVLIAFGVNLLTTSLGAAPGWVMLGGGVLAQGFGLFYSFREAR